MTISPSPESGVTLQQCLQTCQQCHQICLQTAMRHCLSMGGAHVEENHFRLMMSCAELCQTAANFMLGAAPLHKAVCAACVQLCTACADSCEQLGGMSACVDICRRCARECEAMTQ